MATPQLLRIGMPHWPPEFLFARNSYIAASKGMSYTVRFFDDKWEDMLEFLCAQVTPMGAMAALDLWVSAKDGTQPDIEIDGVRLTSAVSVQVECDCEDEQETGPGACPNPQWNEPAPT